MALRSPQSLMGSWRESRGGAERGRGCWGRGVPQPAPVEGTLRTDTQSVHSHRTPSARCRGPGGSGKGGRWRVLPLSHRPPHSRRFCQEGPPPPAGPAESGSASEARLGRLESGVSFLSKLTGIRVTEYSLSRAELRGGAEDGPRILRKGRLAGHCRDVTFHLEFQLLEMQDEENPSAAITELNIILEPMEYSELSRFVARTEETRDLFRFFRSLHFFLQWCEYRKRTFQYFKEKHGAVVQLPGGPTGDSMGLQSPRVPGFELMVVWTVHIDEDGQVLPRLDLLTKVPEPALTLDSRKVVERAPRCFRTLLQLLGVEAAIEGLVRLLAPEE